MSALSIRIIGLFIVEKRDPRPPKTLSLNLGPKPGPQEAPGLSESLREPLGTSKRGLASPGQTIVTLHHHPSGAARFGCWSKKRSDLVVLMRVFVCRYENILYALGVTFPVVCCGRRNGGPLEVGQMLQTFTTSR